MDTWIESVSGGRTNINPKNIPWDVIRVLIAEMYGGKVDNEGDFSVLEGLVAKTMTPAAFDEGFKIAEDPEQPHGGLLLPSSSSWNEFLSWVKNDLPEREPPTYLGLPSNAEKPAADRASARNDGQHGRCDESARRKRANHGRRRRTKLNFFFPFFFHLSPSSYLVLPHFFCTLPLICDTNNSCFFLHCFKICRAIFEQGFFTLRNYLF